MTMLTPDQIIEELAPLDGERLIAKACYIGICNQGDLARWSGLAPMTISRIKNGKRCTNAQRRAIYWGLLRRAE